MSDVEQEIIENPLALERMLALPLPKQAEKPAHPGWAGIRRLNWERRVKRLRKDWYGDNSTI